VHQLDHRRLVETELVGVLLAVLLDSLGGAQETDNGVFTFGSLISDALCGLAAGIPANGEVLTQQRATSADDDTC
jgi:hypothetical protein